MRAEKFAGFVAHGLVGVAAVDEVLPVDEQALQLDRLYLRAVLLALAALLVVLVVVEVALGLLGLAVEDVDLCPEELFEVAFERGVGEGRDQGVEDVGESALDGDRFGHGPGIVLAPGGVEAVEFQFVVDVGGGAALVLGLVVVGVAVGRHPDRPFG